MAVAVLYSTSKAFLVYIYIYLTYYVKINPVDSTVCHCTYFVITLPTFVNYNSFYAFQFLVLLWNSRLHSWEAHQAEHNEHEPTGKALLSGSHTFRQGPTAEAHVGATQGTLFL